MLGGHRSHSGHVTLRDLLTAQGLLENELPTELELASAGQVRMGLSRGEGLSLTASQHHVSHSVRDKYCSSRLLSY